MYSDSRRCDRPPIAFPGAWHTVVITGPHRDDGGFCRPHPACQFNGKRWEPATMPCHLDTVNPDRGVIVHGLKVQRYTAAGPLRWRPDLPAVPEGVDKIGITDAGELSIQDRTERESALRVIDQADRAQDRCLPGPPRTARAYSGTARMGGTTADAGVRDEAWSLGVSSASADGAALTALTRG